MSRSRDIASSGVTSPALALKAPLASPDFSGTVDLTGTTVSLDDDEISGDKVSGGTIGAGTFSGSLTGATFPTGMPIEYTEWTAQKNTYQTASASFVTTGNGITFTTNAQTSKAVVVCKGQLMCYHSAGHPSRGQVAFYFHSNSTTAGETPSGSIIDTVVQVGGYSTDAELDSRNDMYMAFALISTISVSASTEYIIQLCELKGNGTYVNLEAFTTGYVMEIK